MLDLNFQKRNQTPQNVMTMASIFGFAWFKQLNFVVAKNPPTGFFFQRTGGMRNDDPVVFRSADNQSEWTYRVLCSNTFKYYFNLPLFHNFKDLIWMVAVSSQQRNLRIGNQWKQKQLRIHKCECRWILIYDLTMNLLLHLINWYVLTHEMSAFQSLALWFRFTNYVDKYMWGIVSTSPIWFLALLRDTHHNESFLSFHDSTHGIGWLKLTSCLVYVQLGMYLAEISEVFATGIQWIFTSLSSLFSKLDSFIF